MILYYKGQQSQNGQYALDFWLANWIGTFPTNAWT